jgi:endoglucanase
LAAAWHVYNCNACIDATCWDGAVREVAARFPVVATEIGTNDCKGAFISPLRDWLHEHGDGYLAWSWNAYGPCRPAGSGMRGSPYCLITSYDTGTPNSEYAQTFFDRLQVVASP